jgi:hypothetical protein
MVDVAAVLRSCRGALSSRARQLTKPLSADLRFLAGFRGIVSDLSAIRRLFRNGIIVMWPDLNAAEIPLDDKRTSRDLENSRFEVVVNNSILDDDAVESLPVPLPMPALLGAG